MSQVRFLCCVAWLLLLVVTEGMAAAQMYPSNDSVGFEGAELRLGVTFEDATTTLLQRNLQLHQVVGKSNLLRVVDAQGTVLGTIRLSAGRVFVISKNLDLQHDPAGTLISLLQEFIVEGKQNCALDSVTSKEASADTRIAHISCGSKSLKIYHRATTGPLNAIEETLER